MNTRSSDMGNKGVGGTSSLLTPAFSPTPEFEHLLEWSRLNASRARKNGACVKKHRESLRAWGESKRRLRELGHWRQSQEFTGREKAALNLSEGLSLPVSDEQSTLILKGAQRYFTTEEIVRLTLTLMAVNDWIDLQKHGFVA